MLAADKLQLQSTLRQQATALKEKEFKLHHENLMTVGTQAAVLAGLDVTMLIELSPSSDSEWAQLNATLWFIPRVIKLFYYFTISTAFCANILVVGQTTILSVMGASLALRGPDGSMMVATDGLYDERSYVFKVFAYGLVSTLCSVILGVWLILPPESAFVCMVSTIYTAFKLREQYRRVKQKFLFDEDDTVDFEELFNVTNHVRSRSNGRRRGTVKETESRSDRGFKTSPRPSMTAYSDDDEFDQSLAARKRINARNRVFENGGDYDYSNGHDTIPLVDPRIMTV